MKKLLLLLVAVAVVFTGCENAGIDGSQLPLIEIIGGGEESFSLDFPSNGMSPKTITFNSNYDWSVKTSDEWIKVSPESGVAGKECQVQVSLEANDTYDLRNGNITLTINKYSVDIAVTQQPKNGLTLSNSEIKLPQSGGAFDVTVLANVDFEYEIKANWIKAVTTRALAENKVRFEAEANSATDPRTGEIVFKGEGLSATLIVTQSQTNIITLSTSTIEMNGSGGEFTVDVSSNIDYKVAIESGCDWIQQLASRAVTTSTLNFSVAKNETDTPRSATITVSGEGIKEIITVTQERVVTTPTNLIYYTSTNGGVVDPYEPEAFNVNIISNTYRNGQGIIEFDGELKEIGKDAFCKCSTLMSITIPNSVTKIGQDAFKDTSSLIRVNICDLATWCGIEFYNYTAQPLYNGAKLYLNDKEVRNLVIPSEVTTIKAFAFYGLKRLTNTIIPNNVTSIGKMAFYGCTGELTVNSRAIEEDTTDAASGSISLFHGSQFTKLAIGDNVTKIGNSTFRGCSYLTSVTIPDSVTSIGREAFYDCTSLTSINIPNRVLSIKYQAFRGCSSLRSITIPDSVLSIENNAFYNCTGELTLNCSCLGLYGGQFTKLTIGDSVTLIKGSAFRDCTSLTSVTIGNSVSSIESYAFYGCSSLTSVTLPDSVTSIGDYTFYGCTSLTSVTIGKGVTSIGDATFYLCSSLTSVAIPDNVTSIGNSVFSNCSSLTIANIGDGVKTMEGGVFSSCSKLTQVTIGKGLTKIPSNTFRNCVSLKSIVIPDNITFIAGNRTSNPGVTGSYNYNGAFAGCQNLTEITIGRGLNKIDSFVFLECNNLRRVNISNINQWCNMSFEADYSNPLSYGADLYANNNLVTNVVVPEGITEVKFMAFYNYKRLESISLPKSLTKIGDGAFSGCTSLSNIILPESLKELGDGYTVIVGDNPGLGIIGRPAISDEYGAFYGCTGIKSITIPKDVVEIKGCVFAGCSNLKTVYSESTMPPLISDSPFPSTVEQIYVPECVYSLYTSAWSKYADIIISSSDLDSSIGDITEDCKIYYTSSDNKIIQPAFATLSNTYENGIGTITCPKPITVIATGAFSGCRKLTSVKLPNSVSSIRKEAFSGCTSLTSVTIPDGVTSIGEDAFYNCKSLTSITIPDSVTSIEEGAFYGCESLTRVDISDLSAWCKISFGNYSESPLYYGAKLYLNGNELTDITIPSDITEIKQYAFSYCESLTSITIPDSVTSIGDYAFYKCSSLTSITIGNSVTSIGEFAFYSCTSLTSATIGNSVTSIGEDAFAHCTSLKSITIPDSVTSIGGSAFYNCTSLTSVTIPNSVTSIGTQAFRDCTGELTINCNIPYASYFRDSAFYEARFTKVTIGSSVTSIGKFAFYNSDLLKEIYCLPTTPPAGDSYMFSNNVSGRKIYVPRNSVEAYKAALNWSDYASDIVGHDF